MKKIMREGGNDLKQSISSKNEMKKTILTTSLSSHGLDMVVS